MTMEHIILAALAENRAIGKDGELPWDIPEEFAHFQRLIRGKTVLLGRRTLANVQGRAGRYLVLSRTLVQPGDGSYRVFPSMDEALAYCAALGIGEVYNVGGTEVYREALERGLATRMILSNVQGSYEADTFFPEWGRDGWRETGREQHDGFEIVTYRKA